MKLIKYIARGLTLLGLFVLAGCPAVSDKPATAPAAAVGGQSPSGASKEYRILAGSELKDMEPLLQKFSQENGVKVVLDFTGSLDAVDRLSAAHQYDAAWLSHGKYLQLVPGVKEQVKASDKTMFSRVVMGIRPAKLKELGWKSGEVSWKQVIDAVAAKKFSFAMTNPAGSNTGFVTLVGVATELSGKGEALQERDIPQAQLKQLFQGVALTASSSSALAEDFVSKGANVDAIINYDSVIQGMVAAGQKLELLIPKEGVITADYPLMQLARSGDQATYAKLVEFLRSAPSQQWISQSTRRLPLKGGDSGPVVNELPFPATLRTVDALLESYLGNYSKPLSTFMLLDVSGSMDEPIPGQRNGPSRLADLKQSVGSLAAGDGSVSGRFSALRAREQVSMTTFAGKVYDSRSWALTEDSAKNKAVLADVSTFVQSLSSRDSTAIYDAILSVYGQAQESIQAGRATAIILITDGENNRGASFRDFQSKVARSGEPRVPIYGVLYGEANEREMKELAALSGGRVFDARKQSLSATVRSIRASL